MDNVASAAPNQSPLRLGSGAMFDRIAHRYDLLNRVLSLGMDGGWRRQAVRALALAPGDTALDVATGTGDVAIRIAQSHPTVCVTGIDPSSAMLGVAARKLLRDALGMRVTLATGDCQHLPFESRHFDGSIIAFGIRNVPDRARGVREMARVTRAGRPVVILELAEPPSGLLGSVARTYVHQVVPRVGAWLSGAREYRYLQESVAAFPSPPEFAAVMAANQVRVRSVISLGFGACTLYVGESQ